MKEIPSARTLASGEAEAQRMIEFAMTHVVAALRAAADKAVCKENILTDEVWVDEKSILNAYPLSNIK